MYMVHIKIFVKNEKELLGMKYDIKKCPMLIIKKRKKESMERIELSNQKSIRRLGEKENYKYLGVFEADAIKPQDKKIFQNQTLCRRNLNKGINTWAIPLVRYSGSVVPNRFWAMPHFGISKILTPPVISNSYIFQNFTASHMKEA